MDHLYGIHRFLAETSPITLYLVIAFVTVALIWICRRISAGEWFNVTYSGQWGDLALGLVAVLGVGVLRHIESPLPWWIGTMEAQVGWVIASFVIAIIPLYVVAVRPIWEEQSAEVLHAFVIVPVLLFLVSTALVVTIWAGEWKILLLELALVILWAGLVVIDFRTGRNDQIAYHAHTGEHFLFGW